MRSSTAEGTRHMLVPSSLSGPFWQGQLTEACQTMPKAGSQGSQHAVLQVVLKHAHNAAAITKGVNDHGAKLASRGLRSLGIARAVGETSGELTHLASLLMGGSGWCVAMELGEI